MMNSISPTTKKIFFSSVLVTIAVVVVAVFVFTELFDRTASYQENLRLVADGVERQKDVDRVQKIITDSEEERLQLLDYSLTNTEVANFLETLEQFANRNTIDLGIGRLEVVEDERTHIEMLRIPFQLVGSEEIILEFLHLVESVPYFSYVENFSMNTSAQSAPLFSASLELRVKYSES